MYEADGVDEVDGVYEVDDPYGSKIILFFCPISPNIFLIPFFSVWRREGGFGKSHDRVGGCSLKEILNFPISTYLF